MFSVGEVIEYCGLNGRFIGHENNKYCIVRFSHGDFKVKTEDVKQLQVFDWTKRDDGFSVRCLIGTYCVRQRTNDWFAEYFSPQDDWKILCVGTESACKGAVTNHYLNAIKDEFEFLVSLNLV